MQRYFTASVIPPNAKGTEMHTFDWNKLTDAQKIELLWANANRHGNQIGDLWTALDALKGRIKELEDNARRK
jgi:hypothetical protein